MLILGPRMERWQIDWMRIVRRGCEGIVPPMHNKISLIMSHPYIYGLSCQHYKNKRSYGAITFAFVALVYG